MTGVGLEDGTFVPADVVVDAAGRRSPVGAWLDGLGRSVPDERVVPCGIAYCSQFFERLGDGPRPALNRGYVGGGSFDRYSCLVFPGDNRTFSVTFGILPEDRALRSLHHEEGFLAAARRVPVVGDWLDAGEARPITSVTTMRGLDNRFRSLVADGRPAALGLLAVGDSACITNPAHTRGSTLAVASALAVARAIDEHADPETRALAVDAHLDAELAPWFWDSVEQDAARLRRWRPQDAPDGHVARPASRTGAVRVTNAEANLAAQRDPIVWRAFTRAQQLLEMPEDVLADPDVVARTGAVLATGWKPPVLAAPSHDDLVEIATAAATPGNRLDRTG